MSILENKVGANLDSYEQLLKEGKKGLKTYFKQIDKKIGSLPGLVALVGDPKAGKSTFLMNVVLRNAQAGIPVLLFDQENGLHRLRTRMLCCLGRLPFEAIQNQCFVGEELTRYNGAKLELESLPIYQTSFLSPEDLELYITDIGKVHGSHVLVIIDSLNRLVQDFDNRRGDVDKWLTFFNDLKAKYEGYLTTIFVTEKGQQDIGQANVSRAKESSSIPYIAEMVLNVYRKEGDPNSAISCVYNRDGGTGLLTKLESSTPYTYEIHDVEYLPE